MAAAIDISSAGDWAQIAHAAAQLAIEIPADELLLMRAPSGQSFRPNGPPAGVSARLGAVLIMLYPDGADLRLPLTIRSQLLPSHQGEVSLPGGRTDPEDTGPAATALRECDEEIGIAPASLQVWGVLPAVYIVPSNFQVTPVVAFSPVLPVWRANPAEVSAVITVSLRELLDPATVVVERWTLRDTLFDVPFFAVAGQKVWGATALILSEFVGRVRAVISARGSGAQTQ